MAPSYRYQHSTTYKRFARGSLEEMQGLRAALGSDYDAAARGTMKLFRTQAEVQGAARL